MDVSLAKLVGLGGVISGLPRLGWELSPDVQAKARAVWLLKRRKLREVGFTEQRFTSLSRRWWDNGSVLHRPNNACLAAHNLTFAFCFLKKNIFLYNYHIKLKINDFFI